MNERYQDNRQGKEAFTRDVIAKVVKQVGYDQANYTANKEGEFVWLFQDRGHVFFDVMFDCTNVVFELFFLFSCECYVVHFYTSFGLNP